MSQPQIPKPTLLVASALVVLVGFAGGVLVSYEGGNEATDAAAVTSSTLGPTPTAVADTSTTQPVVVPSTTSTPPTTEPPETTSTPPPTPAVTEAPVPTVAPTPPPTPAPSPAALQIRYSRDSTGRMLVPRQGSSVVVVHNVGGSVGTFTVQAVGWVTADGVQQVSGPLAPGETRTVLIRAAAGAPTEAGGSVSVYDAGGLLLAIEAVVV